MTPAMNPRGAEKRNRQNLRTGFTTGACSAAAARAAAVGLVTGQVPGRIESLLPNGQRVLFEVLDGHCSTRHAHAVVVKDGGDDPDCTHGAHLTADVRIVAAPVNQILLRNGAGVGTVTQPGLGLDVGGPAINPVPRRNIEQNLREVAAELLVEAALEVTISVPGGEQMAKKTHNDRLGILGGISILGTTGIVRPYSTAAFRASVVQAIQVAAARGQNTVVLTTGGRSEKFVMDALPHLPSTCFIQMGDFLGYALDAARDNALKTVVIGGMVGKLTKMAQGETITHANRNTVDTDLLADMAAALGVAASVCDEIRAAETARYAGERMQALGLYVPFHQALAQRVIHTLSQRYAGCFRLRILVCDFDGNKITEAEENL